MAKNEFKEQLKYVMGRIKVEYQELADGLGVSIIEVLAWANGVLPSYKEAKGLTEFFKPYVPQQISEEEFTIFFHVLTDALEFSQNAYDKPIDEQQGQTPMIPLLEQKRHSTINLLRSFIITHAKPDLTNIQDRIDTTKYILGNYPDYLNKVNANYSQYNYLAELLDQVLKVAVIEGMYGNIVDIIGSYLKNATSYPMVGESLNIMQSERLSVMQWLREYVYEAHLKYEIQYEKTQSISPILEEPARSDRNMILGEPSNAKQFQCDVFMVMPFRDELNEVYEDHIIPKVEQLGLTIKRGDDPFSSNDIITEIWSYINNCQYVIADCTGRNTNVFYEIGLAHAIDKPVILITQDSADVPFDLRHRRYIKYNFSPRGMKSFESKLVSAMEGILDENNS